ncbi:hydroxyproline O-galactosyltransferase HPGT1 isoform X1 [Beta vulgaris subsp. vulgaris]|uniref:hydroxyproline O-galactosyltransferase HPGT1 isoform X1 n=1 Tax=Beta vulgaris subsp. vulgaris TaxID=3555 RepID=UPI0020375CFB|nr:hydroxyproline O-galactosyltransferase HPGT1 isoform X1 [Beta vulgaris subsp. vulgaris]
MQRKGSNQRLSSSSSNKLLRSRISFLMLSMFATIASFYVAGRLWQDAQNRVYIINELEKITGQGRSAISVDDSLKVIACREQQKKLSALQMELAAAREEGFVPKYHGRNKAKGGKKPLVVIGILTSFGRKSKRDAVRKAWMGTGTALKKMENEKGIVPQFVIGRSENRGDSLDLDIDIENRQNNDFIILEDHVETSKELPKKTMYFFAHVANNWEAEFYAKVNDDVYINIDVLGNTLAAHVSDPRVYMGCMKSGEVFSEPNQKWYEPEWWKFGDGKSYFRHASGEIFVISQALAKFVSINRSNLRTYAHDDVSVGSWFIGLDVKHIDERKFCCSSWASSGAICAGVR